MWGVGLSSRRRVGFVVNPVAGMGGRVGLKGTDGLEVLRRARELGALPVAGLRAGEFLGMLAGSKDYVELVTWGGEMGEDVARGCGFSPTVLGSIVSGRTSGEDTRRAVGEMVEFGVELVVFVGGDGTARDVCEAVGERVPVLGVPAGVKIHSAVFAVSPVAAGELVVRFLFGGLPLREGEVMDVDEDAFREGRVSARLYGYMVTPYVPALVQGGKVESVVSESELRSQAAIAVYVIDGMESDVVYVMGPGTTTRTIGDLLDESKTLLGVDIFLNKKIVVKDANEAEILKAVKGKGARIVVTPIGGQGFIFGRGNQQISPRVIREVGLGNIVVVATRGKLRGLECLRVDTGDSVLDAELRGCVGVVTDYGVVEMVQVE